MEDEQNSTTEEKFDEQIQLPVNILALGEIENDDIKVYVYQKAYNSLEKYAREDTEHERGTILIGEYHEEMGKIHVIISDFIRAKYTDASASTLTFTHNTWDYIHKQHDAKFSDKKIVGWQHTHPGYGIFLSNYDLFIHENFFNLPFQIAYVIDPVQQIRGFFQWKNGKIEKLNGFYVYNDVGKPIKIFQKSNQTELGNNESEKRAKLLISSIILTLIVAFASFFSFIYLRREINSQDQLIAKQQELIDNQKGMIDELTSDVSQIKEFQSDNGDEYIIYVVKRGDTLKNICTKLNIDYQKNKSIILSLNRIQNENVIVTGYILVFPKTIQNN